MTPAALPSADFFLNYDLPTVSAPTSSAPFLTSLPWVVKPQPPKLTRNCPLSVGARETNELGLAMT